MYARTHACTHTHTHTHAHMYMHKENHLKPPAAMHNTFIATHRTNTGMTVDHSSLVQENLPGEGLVGYCPGLMEREAGEPEVSQ